MNSLKFFQLTPSYFYRQINSFKMLYLLVYSLLKFHLAHKSNQCGVVTFFLV